MAASRRLLGAVGLMLLGAFASLANGATAPVPAQTLNVDLEPAIRSSALRPERFAVDVPVTASVTTEGAWTRANGVSTWRHAVRIPTAVSMSFHASGLNLPSDATLQVSAGTSTVVYRQRDASAGGLWGRVLKGDTLNFEITVRTSSEAQVVFTLASLQAGYRGLGGAVKDHPFYTKLRAMNAVASAAPCLENFACHETAENFGPRNATAAIVVSGVALCTATLINDVRGDMAHYLLTARHCQVNTSSPSSVTVYWDATVPCVAALGAVYDTLTPAYSGGGTHTVIEQQDVWLLEFGPELVADHVYFAGWDATGGTFVGGYSPHHAHGRSRQYAGWFGQALLHDINNSALGSGYRGTFWGVVNQVGSIGSGASGGGLFDSQNRLVGTLSLGLLGSDGEGVCPVGSPQAPRSSNTVGEYNALAAVWDSTADITSTTNPRTLKSVLDPDNTGTKVVDGFELLKGAYVAPDSGSAFTGSPVRLTWSAPGATTCTAEGGRPGDGWSGSIGASGNRTVTETDAGLVTYGMRCTEGARRTYVSGRVDWSPAPATLSFSGDTNDTYVGQSKRLTWNSNVQPCVASGGVSGDGWAGTKPQSGTQDVVLGPGQTTFTLACGTGNRVASYSLVVNSWPVAAYLLSVGLVDNLRIGQYLDLAAAGGPSCVRSGGAAGDGWATSTGANTLVTEIAPGVYTYTITCTGGGQTASESITRTFNGDPPFATLVATPNRFEAGPGGPVADNSHGQGAELRWTSNLPSCNLNFVGPPGTASGPLGFGTLFNSDYWRDLQPVAGIYTYTVTCTGNGQSATATTTIEFFTSQPSVNLTLPAILTANQAVPIRWESNVLPCTAGQGGPGDGWPGPKANASGSQDLIETVPGTYVFDITCGSGASIARAEVTATVPVPGVTITSPGNPVTVGFFATIDWSASTGPCVLSSNPANPDWTGTRFANGRAFVTEQVPGTYTYTATCGPSGATVTGSGQVTFDPSPFATSTFSANTATANVNEPVTLTWTSTNTDYCTSSANTAVSDWGGPVALSGSATVKRTFPGTVGYVLSCNGASMKVVQVTFIGPVDSPNPFIPPNVTFSASHTQRLIGEQVTLTWNSTHASECAAAGGTSGDGWTGVLALAASQTVTEATPGNYTYFVTCSGAPPSAQAQVTVQFLAPAPNNGGGGGNSSGGGKGGGRLDWLLIAMLASLAIGQLEVRRRVRTMSPLAPRPARASSSRDRT